MTQKSLLKKKHRRKLSKRMHTQMHTQKPLSILLCEWNLKITCTHTYTHTYNAEVQNHPICEPTPEEIEFDKRERKRTAKNSFIVWLVGEFAHPEIYYVHVC